MKSAPSHVAVLVPSVRKAAEHLKQFNFQIGKAEEWEGEGTLEIYIEVDKKNPLLLMEPVKPGAYQRAMEKRGPGLHHLAIDVLNLEEYIESLAGSGWLLHPTSIHTMKHAKTAYLARPGFPGLIEVQQKEKLREGSLFVTEVSLPLETKLVPLIQSIGLEGIVKPSAGELSFTLGGVTSKLQDLL